MSSRKGSFQFFSDGLGIPEEKIKQAFYENADDQGFIDPGKFQDILETIKLIVPDAYQRLRILINAVNSTVLESYDTDALSFQDFQEILENILFQGQPRNLRYEKSNYHAIQNNTNVIQNERPKNDPLTLSKMPWPKNYRNNKEKLDKLLKNHRDELYIKFKEKETSPGSGRITIQDYYAFLQECLFLDSLALLEREEDSKNFFQLEDSYNRLCKVVDAYFVKSQQKGTDSQVFTNLTLTFLQCFDILDNWFKVDHGVVLLDDIKQQSTIEDLLMTISKYEIMMKNSQNKIEKQTVKSIIQALYERIEGLTKSYRVDNETSRSPRPYSEIREEKRIRALKEIFDFFCRKGLKIAKGYTFESINKQYTGMSLEKLSVMLKDFNVKIEQFKLVELFNKIKQGLEFLSFEDFEALLKKIAQDAELVTDIKEYKFDRSIMKNYKPDTYKKSPIPKKEKAESLNSKNTPKVAANEQEKIEALWSYMGLYDESYKKAFGGIRVNLNMIQSDKSEIEIIDQDQTLGVRHKAGQIKLSEEETERRKETANNLRGIRTRKRIVSKDLVPSMVYRSERSSANVKAKGKHLCLRPEDVGDDIVARSLTLQQAEHLSDRDIKKMDKNFHPLSLIGQNDDDDELYLAEYDLTRSNRKKEDPVSEKAAVKTKLPLLYKVPPSLRRYSQIYTYKTHRQEAKNESFNHGRSTTEEAKMSERESETNSKNGEIQSIHDAIKAHQDIEKGERRSVPVSSKQRSISSDVLERANQVQEYLKNRQLKMIDNILNIQAIMHDRGFKTAWK